MSATSVNNLKGILVVFFNGWRMKSIVLKIQLEGLNIKIPKIKKPFSITCETEIYEMAMILSV